MIFFLEMSKSDTHVQKWQRMVATGKTESFLSNLLEMLKF